MASCNAILLQEKDAYSVILVLHYSSFHILQNPTCLVRLMVIITWWFGACYFKLQSPPMLTCVCST